MTFDEWCKDETYKERLTFAVNLKHSDDVSKEEKVHVLKFIAELVFNLDCCKRNFLTFEFMNDKENIRTMNVLEKMYVYMVAVESGSFTFRQAYDCLGFVLKEIEAHDRESNRQRAHEKGVINEDI